MGIQVTRSGTNWTVDVTALGLVNDTAEKDFLVVINKVEQPLTAYVKTTATVITYSGAALPDNTVVYFYRWGLRDVDPLEYGEVTSQLGMNRRLTQIERVLDDLREVKQFIWSGVDGTAAVATHVAQVDPHTQYRLKSADIPVTDLSGVLSDAQIPSLIARDTEVSAAVAAHEALANPHPGYTTAAQLTAALTGYLPTSQKGAVNGIAPLDGSSKIPAINSRGCSAVYTASTGVWLFTWADGATQSIDTPLELVFQSVNYNTTTKQVTFTLVGGATTSFSLTDLVDLPEVQVATATPSATPTTGQRLYFRSDTGDYWVSNGTAWAGPFLNITAGERAQLAGLTTALNAKQNADPTLQSIADSTETGLIRRDANEAVTLLPAGAMAGPLLAAGDAAAVRAVAGCGTMAAQNANAVAITGGTAGFTGFFNSSTDLPLGVYLGNEGTPRVVFSSGLASTAWSIDNVNGAFRWFTPGVLRMSLSATNSELTLHGPLKFNGGATQTASLRGIKTIDTPSITDTITVVGAAVGDIVRLSRGRDGYVSAANTVTFDSSGLAGVVVSAIVERFT